MSSFISLLNLFSNLICNFDKVAVILYILFALSVPFFFFSFKNTAPPPPPPRAFKCTGGFSSFQGTMSETILFLTGSLSLPAA